MAKKKQPPKTEDEGIILSEEQVKETIWNFQQFTQQLNRGNGLYPGVLNPLLLNQRMQDIALNPMEATDTKLATALLSPKENEESLRGFSEYFEIISQPYKRMLEYLSSMLSWDLTYTCINAEKDDYGTEAYKKEEKKLESFLDRFTYKQEFAVVVKELLRNEAYFCSPRFIDSEQIVLQELPSTVQYTKITGRWAYGLLFSMNLQWFMQPGTNLDMYDPFFAESFNELFEGNPLRKYLPSLPADMRGSSSWIYWQDIPVDVGWCWKMSPEIITRLPHFTGLFSDLILQPLMRNLQKNANMASATKLLTGEVPFLQNTGAKVKDALAMSPDTLAKFLQLVSSALSSSIKMTAAPLNNINGVSFPAENEIYPTYLKNMLAASGLNTNLIFTSDVRPNQLESQLSLNSDEQLVTSLYPQFDNFLNYHGGKVTKKFKWRFNFEGTEFFTNRAERLDRQSTMMQNGIVLPKKISAALGMRYADFRRQLEEGVENGFVEKLTPILMANQMSGNETGGRPLTPNNKLGDAGAQSRESGTSNTTRKPKVK